MTAPNSLPPIESVLSHRGTMLLLDRVLHYDAQPFDAPVHEFGLALASSLH